MTTCERCGAELQVGDYPFCGKDGRHLRGANAVIPDDIPGGIVIEHGICHDDGSPRRYYSKSEINRTAKAKGLVNYVRHVGDCGSDKSPFTTRWV
jgi:hypothetical protein